MMDLQKVFTYPYDNDLLLRKQKKLKRLLLTRQEESCSSIRIAILGGSTVDDIKNILEIFLLESRIKGIFYQSEYNKFYEDAVFGNEELDEFQPEIVLVFTSVVNITNWPTVFENTDEIEGKLQKEFQHFQQVWEAIKKRYNAIVIQNNFDFPPIADMGSIDSVIRWGKQRYISELNAKFAAYAQENDNFYIHDLCRLSAKIGLNTWHSSSQYYAYKLAMNYDAIPEVSLGLAKIIRAIKGKNKKCLVLDLDNTLWGGVIGDDGLAGIKIGHETPVAEAYTAFQKYVLELKKRGIILAVCSKNEDDIARTGFTHPDSVLHIDDFASFHANWEPKHTNVAAIAKELNIGTDSLVFIDDNPVERQIIRDNLPEVAVPEVDSSDVNSYIKAIEGAGYFEVVTVSDDDLRRNDSYKGNKARMELESSAKTYDDFLESLDMKAEIDNFKAIYLDRIAQLTGKTNQFNLTTKRFTRAEIEAMASNPNYIALYGRLADKFGDNGLVSVMIGEKHEESLHIILWLMSCRVLKRGMEFSMMDALVEKAKREGCKEIVGYYYPTKKNAMVENLYAVMGFGFFSSDEKGTVWKLMIKEYQTKGKHIKMSGVK